MSKLSFILRFVKYYFTGVNRHSLHAPFLYNLNENVFRFDKGKEIYKAIELLRKERLNDHSKINVRDFGAGFGGKVYKELTVDFITKRSSKPARYARLLNRLVEYLRPEYLLELGTSVGISALYQSAGNPSSKLITLEGCENTAALAEDGFKRFPHLNIKLIQGSFDETLAIALKQFPKLDYVFVDGNHKLEPTLKYFNECLPYFNKNSVMIFDDVNWSDEMGEAWKQIKAHPKVTLTIDVFMLGIIFFNPELSKENFVIRY